MDEVVGSDDQGEPLMLHDVLSTGGGDPGTKAARKIDWSEFLAGLSRRDQATIRYIVEGKSLSSLARRKGINSSTLRYSKERLGRASQEFMGVHILTDMQRHTAWKDSIHAARERMAVRDERRTL